MRTTPLLLAALALPLLAGNPRNLQTDEDRAWIKPPETNGTLVVCNQAEGNVYLSSLKTARVVRRIATGTGPHEAAVSPSGKLIAISNYGDQRAGNSISIIQLPKGELVKTISLGEYTRPHGLAWVDESKLLSTSETTANVVLVDVEQVKVLRIMPTFGKASHMLALAPAKDRVYTANIMSSDVTAIDFATGKKLWQAPVGEGSEGIGVSPDGKWVWTANVGKHSVSIVDTAKGETVTTIDVEGRPYRIAFSRTGDRVLVPTPMAGTLTIFGAKSRTVEKKLSFNHPKVKFRSESGNPIPGPVGVTVHPNGRYAYAAVHWAYAVAVIDMQKLEIVGSIEAGKSPDGVAVSPIDVE